MKIVGVREISGTSKETGRAWSGVKLYYTEPISSRGAGFANGFGAGSAYFGGASADAVRAVAGDRYTALLGAEVTITYNRFGRPVGLSVE